MTLNQRLIEWRKGYFSWLKIAYSISGLFIAIIDSAVEAFPALGKLLLKIIIALTFPIWFFPATFIDYKYEYKRLKKRFADCHIDLTDDYQPKEKKDEKT